MELGFIQRKWGGPWNRCPSVPYHLSLLPLSPQPSSAGQGAGKREENACGGDLRAPCPVVSARNQGNVRTDLRGGLHLGATFTEN